MGKYNTRALTIDDINFSFEEDTDMEYPDVDIDQTDVSINETDIDAGCTDADAVETDVNMEYPNVDVDETYVDAGCTDADVSETNVNVDETDVKAKYTGVDEKVCTEGYDTRTQARNTDELNNLFKNILSELKDAESSSIDPEMEQRYDLGLINVYNATFNAAKDLFWRLRAGHEAETNNVYIRKCVDIMEYIEGRARKMFVALPTALKTQFGYVPENFSFALKNLNIPL
jgi:hypothetical protein